MTYLSDAEVEERLNGERNLLERLFVRPIDLLPKVMTPEVAAAVVEAAKQMPQAEIARALNISNERVNQITTGDRAVHPDTKVILENKMNKIRNKSLQKLIEFIDVLDADKVDGDPVKAANVAEKLANIASKMEPPEDRNRQGTAVQVNVFTPRIREADSYETIEVVSIPKS